MVLSKWFGYISFLPPTGTLDVLWFVFPVVTGFIGLDILEESVPGGGQVDGFRMIVRR